MAERLGRGVEEEMQGVTSIDALDNIAKQIADFKRCVQSENSDYLTGYLCALSVVEGMIAEIKLKRGDADD